MKKITACSIGIFLILTVTSCNERDSYTLYRDSVLDSGLRIHIATFNASEVSNYNMENCIAARDLFQNQPGVKTRFWCEKGYFKK